MSSTLISIWAICKAIPCKSRGLYAGCPLLFAYWVINIYKKKTFSVELDVIAVIVICGEGITSSGQFLLLILNASSPYLGNLKDYRLNLFLGTVAIIHVSLKSLSKIFSKAITQPNINSRTDQSIPDPNSDPQVSAPSPLS